MGQKELLIVIPVYNEEKNIPKVLEQLRVPKITSIADILVVDDASTDLSGRIAQDMHYLVLKHPHRLGYGSALQLGYKYAVRNGYQYVIQMDADGQHDTCNILPIFRRLKEKAADGKCPDIVLASRFMKGSTEFPVSLFRRMAYNWFRSLIRMASGRRIADPTTGLQGLSRKAFLYYSGRGHFDKKYPDANMVLQMLLLKFRIVEMPAVMHVRKDGKSMHSGLEPIWYMIRMSFSVFAVIFRIKLLKSGVGADLESVDRA